MTRPRDSLVTRGDVLTGSGLVCTGEEATVGGATGFGGELAGSRLSQVHEDWSGGFPGIGTAPADGGTCNNALGCIAGHPCPCSQGKSGFRHHLSQRLLLDSHLFPSHRSTLSP